ncbi:MAG: cytochrome c family protein [Boseongicola sp.]|nr:cytochrome c family protein [Boseongicola sp.]
MFDTMTMTKTLGGLCGTFLVFLLGGFAAEFIYHPKHGDDHHQAYTIEVEGSGEAEEEVAEVPFADVYALADAGAGERLWRQCQACHKLESGANGTGPYLANVVGRPKGAAEGYSYSTAMANFPGEWTPEALNEFLISPNGYIDGTKMNYRGMPDVEDRANLIAFLETAVD